MGKWRRPPADAPEHIRIVPERVWFALFYVPAFPSTVIEGKLDKVLLDGTVPGTVPLNALLGLKADIAKEGKFRNPVIVWNHHALRGTKQPKWLLRAGSNRMWCADQLGWSHVPAIVSVCTLEDFNRVLRFGGQRVHPEDLQSFFPDGGLVWANEEGFGLALAKPPEKTYAGYAATAAELSSVRPTEHGRLKMIDPMVEE